MTIEQFGKALVASGLMTADDVKAFWTAIPADARPKDGAGLGKQLAEKTLLTPFQVAEIIAGRGARLMMGDYTIVTQIGAGGMGQVYKAQHRRMKRTVALKVMSNAAMQDEAAVKRFQREVHAAAKLEHPNIVTAYDSGEVGNVKYLVMQFVDGGDLSELVKKQGRLGVTQAVGYVIQAAKGLAFAHGEGVIHRDIKPANLLLDKKGVVKILDMGLARFEDGGDGLTATEQVMGTVDYMSPEQAANTKGCDGRADIYSLGCTLWYLLTAKKVYEADTLIARLMKHRDGELPSLVKERDDAPWPLEQALHKMIAKRVQDRYQTMDEVVAALAPFSGDAASSGSIGGASSGGGPSADLASFMQSMGTGGTKASPSATEIKPATSTNIDATAQFSSPDAGTDPKSAILPKGTTSPTAAGKAKPSAKKSKPINNRTKLIAAGALGGMLLLAGIIVKIRDKDGNVVAEVNAPTGTSVEVVTQPQAVVKPNAQSIPVTPAALPIAQMLDSPDYGWGAPENLGPNVNSISDDWKPTLTADELRMVFRGDGGASQDSSSLWECRRASIDQPFGPRARLTGSAYEDEPFLSGDGLTLLYDTHAVASGRTAEDIRVRRRTSLEAPWTKPESLPLAEDRDEQSPWLSLDGLTLIYAAPGGVGGSRDLWTCSRTANDAKFGPSATYQAGANSPASESCPQLLSDGRTLLFSRDGKPHLTFTSRNGVQSALQLYGLADDVRDAWLSNDGRRLYFNSKRAGGLGGYDIWMMRLMPKNGATPSVPAFVASASPSFVPPATPATPPPPGDYALRFAMYNRAEAPNPQLDESQPFTVEAYITPGDADPSRMIGEQRLFGIDAEFHFEIKNNRWRFYSTHNEALSPERFTPRRRVHVAGVRTTTGRRLYLDGKLVASMDEPLTLKSKQSESPLVVEARGSVEFTFDEIRISQGIVYDKPFTPPAKLTADKNTLALYHFDEGFGDVVKDSSGKGRDGKITGATWVKADGSPIPETSIAAGASPTPPTTATIPAEALTFGGHRYLLVDSAPGKRPSWNEARTRSEAMGGHLATINSREELEWMRTTFRNVPAANDTDRATYRLWLGGIGDVQNLNRWTWVTGEPFDRALWPGDGPDGAEAASTLALSWYGDVWDDAPPQNLARFFLVEWDTLVPATSTTKLFVHDPAFPQWMKDVQAKPAEQQIEAVSKKLMELNPGFDGVLLGRDNKGLPTIKDGAVTIVHFDPRTVSDLSPLRAFSGLVDINAGSTGVRGRGKLRDLTPLAGLKLAAVSLYVTSVDDLSPLHGMPIGYLNCGDISIHDLRPLKDMPLTQLFIPSTQVSDLSPLSGAPLQVLNCERTLVADLSPLENCRDLTSLNVKETKVTPATVAALRKALPNCKIEWDDPAPSLTAKPANALQFDGQTAHVATPLTHLTNSPFTIEVTLLPGSVGTAIISNSEGSGLGLDMVDGIPNFLAFRGASGTKSYARATAPQPLDTSRSHKLAAVFDGAKIRLFVDGKLAATSDLAGEYLPSNLPFIIGASPEEQGIDYPFNGALDEVRFSKTARYSSDYTPHDRLPSDPDTLAMYHFDEGSGDVLKDSSGNSRHGKIVGAKWVKVDGTPASASAPLPTVAATPAKVAAWLLDNKKLAKIGFEVDGKRQLMSTVPTAPFKVFELSFSPSNNAGKPLTEAEIARLVVFADLESLELGNQPLTDAGLAGLLPLKKLKTLIVNNTPLTPASVATIRQFPQLETLHAFSTDEWLKPLAGMPSIKSLKFHRTLISPEAMSWFPQYPNLKELDLVDTFTTAQGKISVALAHLKECKKLSKLKLNCGFVDPDTLGVLSGLTGLLELDLGSTNFTESQVKQLAAALPQCKTTWRDSAQKDKKHVFEPTAPPEKTGAADPAFEQWLKDVAAKPADAQLAAGSKKLMELNAGFDGTLTDPKRKSTPVVEAGVVVGLGLNHATITDISPLRAFTDLKELNFGGSGPVRGKLTDLSPLAALPIIDLNLSGMGHLITDLKPAG